MKDIPFAEPLFEIGGSSHIIALIALVLLGTAFILWGRKCSLQAPAPTPATRLLAYACLGGIAASLAASRIDMPDETWTDALPLHFCDFMAAVCAWALLSRSLNAKAIAFFCVMCASLQALVTPNLQLDHPHLTYYTFFFSHGITVISAIYIPLVLKWRPRKYDFLVAQLFGVIYLIIIHLINNLLDTNFGFTRFLPANGSILSLLGPWPWYLIVMQIPAFLFMFSLNIILYKKRSLS